MPSNQSIKWVLFSSLFLILLGCRIPQTPTPLPNQPPIVVDMIVSPVTIQAGSTAHITVIANDPEGDAMAYYWSANKGMVPGGSVGEFIRYTAPEQGGLDTITVQVTDGKNTTRESISVSVLVNPELSQDPPSTTPVPESELTLEPPPVTETLASTSQVTPTSTFAAPPTESPEPDKLQPLIEDSSNTKMILIPAGSFVRGSDPDEVQEMCVYFYGEDRPECTREDFEDEAPTHTVTLSDYYIDLYEVTNAQYARCVADGVCNHPFATTSATRDGYFGSPKYGDYPVVHIGWYQAQTYCEWRGANLPTEAEWEKAARGIDSFPFPWGSDKPKAELLNFNGIIGDTTPVGSYPEGVSPYGIYDMAGNVSEWVADTFSRYSSDEIKDPLGPSFGTRKVIRGGGWHSSGLLVRSAERTWAEADEVFWDVGFRCALTP